MKSVTKNFSTKYYSNSGLTTTQLAGLQCMYITNVVFDSSYTSDGSGYRNSGFCYPWHVANDHDHVICGFEPGSSLEISLTLSGAEYGADVGKVYLGTWIKSCTITFYYIE